VKGRAMIVDRCSLAGLLGTSLICLAVIGSVALLATPLRASAARGSNKEKRVLLQIPFPEASALRERKSVAFTRKQKSRPRFRPVCTAGLSDQEALWLQVRPLRHSIFAESTKS
jgi:hypothetical protein